MYYTNSSKNLSSTKISDLKSYINSIIICNVFLRKLYVLKVSLSNSTKHLRKKNVLYEFLQKMRKSTS